MAAPGRQDARAGVVAACLAVEAACAATGRWVAWLVLPLMAAVLATVLTAGLRVNEIVRWDTPLPLLGEAVTGNTLLDLQWHLFLLLVLFGGAYALFADAHVKVDLLSAGFSERVRTAVGLVGDLVFLLPFAAFMAWFGVAFAARAYATGEGSTYGGLLDRWLIKAALPLAFALLAVMALARIVRAIAVLLPARRRGR